MEVDISRLSVLMAQPRVKLTYAERRHRQVVLAETIEKLGPLTPSIHKEVMATSENAEQLATPHGHVEPPGAPSDVATVAPCAASAEGAEEADEGACRQVPCLLEPFPRSEQEGGAHIRRNLHPARSFEGLVNGKGREGKMALGRHGGTRS